MASETMTHRFAWGAGSGWQNEKRRTLRGRACRIVARSRRMASILIEFDNGQREIVSRRAVRKVVPQ